MFNTMAIDKAKGIIAKPMPRDWHDRHAANKIEDEDKRDLYRSIVAAKKPYFMRYIYPSLMKEYNTYINNTNRNALREFQMTVAELEEMPSKDLSDRQREFLRHYYHRMPVGISNCVMNRICRSIEQEFDHYISRKVDSQAFDYRIMKTDAEYTPKQFAAIKHLYDDYNKRLSNYAIFSNYERIDDADSYTTLNMMNEDFRRECDKICPNREVLCNIILDICYRKSSTKRFAWNMCGDEIIHNLLKNNGNIISYPTLDPDGDLTYCGDTFSVECIELKEDEDDSIE